MRSRVGSAARAYPAFLPMPLGGKANLATIEITLTAIKTRPTLRARECAEGSESFHCTQDPCLVGVLQQSRVRIALYELRTTSSARPFHPWVIPGLIEIIEMGGFSLAKTGSSELEKLWLRGGSPLFYLVANAEEITHYNGQTCIRTGRHYYRQTVTTRGSQPY